MTLTVVSVVLCGDKTTKVLDPDVMGLGFLFVGKIQQINMSRSGIVDDPDWED